jgi:hypothetical protein
MAVGKAGIGYTSKYILGGVTSGSVDCPVTVSSASDTYGLAFFGLTGDTDVSTAGAFTATWNGVAMTPASTNPLWFDAHSGHFHSVLVPFIIADPTSGDVAVSYSGVEGGLITKNVFLAAVAFSSVEALDLGSIASAVVTATGSTSVATSGVTVPSGVPADRVISAHLIGQYRAFSGFTGTKLAAPLRAGGGQLLVGETRGATSVVPTVTHNASSANWAAWGLNLDALPIETLGFATSTLTIPAGNSFGVDLYRFAQPHPDRDYMVPKSGSADATVIAGATVRSANGVLMPVWVKDPDDTLDYTLRWNNHLAPDDEIVSVEHTPSGSVRIISEAINPDDTAMTQFWTRGATRGVTHPVRVRFWTKRGRQHDFTVFIAGENN